MPAESQLPEAIRDGRAWPAGVSPADDGRCRTISLDAVHARPRRITVGTGPGRIADPFCCLSDLRVPLQDA